MARRRGTAILKRQREVKKAEKQALKREKRMARREQEGPGSAPDVASREDLEAYGYAPPSSEDEGTDPSDEWPRNR